MSYLEMIAAQPLPPAPIMLKDRELPFGFEIGLSRARGKGFNYFILLKDRKMIGKYRSRDVAISEARKMAKEIA